MEIKIFEGNQVNILEENGEPLFEIYSTGMALGQVKIAKGQKYPRKDRIDENLRSAEIMPVVRCGQLFITEEQLYDLMLEMKTDKVKPFRKWITSEVLPSIRKTGLYGEVNLEELIAKTAVAVVNEIMKQNVIQSDKLPEPEEPYIRKSSLASSIIGRLDAELQLEIDDMILSNRYTYMGIKEYLKENYGISISTSSIQRRKEILYGQSKRRKI